MLGRLHHRLGLLRREQRRRTGAAGQLPCGLALDQNSLGLLA